MQRTVIRLKLNVKMMILFSVIMMTALFFFSSYTIDYTTKGSNALTASRFTNMSSTISAHLEQHVAMMNMTINDLTERISFMSSLNQFVRDTSDDQKMGLAARKAILQNLYQSPMVEQYYRVSFISLEGKYITTLPAKDFDFAVPPEVLTALTDSFSWADQSADHTSYQMLPPHTDIFTPRQDIMVYGIVQPVYYSKHCIGYISVLNECRSLDHILEFVDNTSEVEVQASFDDESPFYCSKDTLRKYPCEMPVGTMQEWYDPETGTTMQVMHTHLDALGLNLYVSHDKQININGNHYIQKDIYQRMFLIMLAAFVMIGVFSFQLTRSIRRMTKRVLQMSSRNVLLNNAPAAQALTETVTAPSDQEIHALELAYNDMLLRLRDSAFNEMTLRESALQAHLNALQTQISPHFIYNTLNIISAKSLENGNFDVIKICDQFASMLRYSTDTHSHTATVQEEIENVRNYLLLAKARYEDNLEFLIQVPDNLQNIELPKLALQPLVENALTHGYDGKNIQRKLSVIGKITDSTLILEIRDNGTGFSPEILHNLQQRIADIETNANPVEKDGSHIGLINTCLRLHYYSKGAIHISIHNDNGAVVTLAMPVTR